MSPGRSATAGGSGRGLCPLLPAAGASAALAASTALGAAAAAASAALGAEAAEPLGVPAPLAPAGSAAKSVAGREPRRVAPLVFCAGVRRDTALRVLLRGGRSG